MIPKYVIVASAFSQTEVGWISIFLSDEYISLCRMSEGINAKFWLTVLSVTLKDNDLQRGIGHLWKRKAL